MRRTLNQGADPTQATRFRYAGLEFKVTSWGRPLGVVPTAANLPLEAVACLSAETYNTKKHQSVLDALSPFQLMSKAFALRGLETLLHTKGPLHNELVYFGSWFGQQAVMDYLWWASTPENWRPAQISSLTLIDLDPIAVRISERLLHHCFASVPDVKTTFLAQDALAYHPSWEGPPGTVIWNGMEHFDLAKAAHYIRYSQPGTRYLILSTDMPSDDHVVGFNDTYAFSELWSDRPVKVHVESCLSVFDWNRWMVGFTVL